MIERNIRAYLSSKLAAPVFMEVPEKAPDSFVVLEKTGSAQNNRINAATIVAQSYAETLLQAAELNETVKLAMNSLDELAEVCRVQLNSDYNFTDTASKRYCYQAVFDVTHY